MRVNVFVVTYLFSLLLLYAVSVIINYLNLVDVNDGGKREMQDARNASHVISRGNKSDSPQTVLCNVTQLFARSKSVTLGCHPLHGRGPKIRFTKRGLMR